MEKCSEAASKLVPSGYISQGCNSLRAADNSLKHLVEQRRLPEQGWSDLAIERCLHEVALMDSNNFPGNVGGGEREGRVYSDLVKRRHYHLAHGMGRSGDIAANQPKAAGSALLCRVTEGLVLDVLRYTGVKSTKACVVLPVATGMSLLVSLLYLKQTRPRASVVIWPRIDQKTCIKAPQTAGCRLVVVENILEGDSLVTDVDTIASLMKEHGDQVLCVLSTTSCFAPRTPDKLVHIARLCKDHDVPHLVNNAYGIQSSRCMNLIESANQQGRVDLYVQSLDKNFLVPVGGSVIAGFSKLVVGAVAQSYPGRGSSTPTTDLFITLLSMGRSGFCRLLEQRSKVYEYLKEELSKVGSKYQERVLETPHNQISLGFTLSNLNSNQIDNKDLTELGSMLFQRNVTGARVVTSGITKTIGAVTFNNFGSHSNHYPVPYVTFAAGIGMTLPDVDTLVGKLDKVLHKLYDSKSLCS